MNSKTSMADIFDFGYFCSRSDFLLYLWSV